MQRFLGVVFVGILAGASVWATPASADPLVYVTDPAAGTLTVVDAATNAVVTTVSGLPGADAVAVSADGNDIYVAERDAGAIAVLSRNAILNPPTPPVVQTLNVGGAPVALALDPSNTQLYVADSTNDVVLEVNTGNGNVIDTYPTASGLDAVALSPSGLLLAIATTSNNTVQIVRTGGSTTVSLTSAPTALSFSPDGETLWVAETGGFASYSVANGTLNSQTVTGGTTSTAYDIRSNTAYFGAGSGDQVYSYAPAGGTVTPIAVAGPVSGLALSPDASRVYAVQACTNCGVAVIDTAQQQDIAQVSFGQAPQTAGDFAGPGAITAENAVANVLVNNQTSGIVVAQDSANRNLSYQLLKGPAAGNLGFAVGGDWVYAPPVEFSGVQTFVWQALAMNGAGSPTTPVSRPVTETVAVYPTSNPLSNLIIPPGGVLALPLTINGSAPIKVSFASSDASVIAPASISTTPGCGTSTLSCTIVAPVTASVGTGTTITMTLTDASGLQSSTSFSVSVQNSSGGGALSPEALAGLLCLGLVLGWAQRRTRSR